MSSMLPDGWSFSRIGDAVISSSGGVSVNSENRPVTVNELGILKTSSVVDGRFYPAEHKTILSDEVERVSIKPKKNHILFSRMNTPLLVGQSGFVERDYEHLFLPDRLWQLEIAGKFNPKWLSYLLRSQDVVKLITDAATGTSNTMKNIAKPNLMAIPMMSPPLPEQQKIAKILTSVDEVIEKIQAQIDKLKDLKTAMMQELLTQGVCDENGKRHVEFKDSPVGRIPVGWEVVELSKLVKQNRPITYGIVQTGENIDDGIPCVRVVDLMKNEITTQNMIRTTVEISKQYGRTILEKGDIMFALRGNIGHVISVEDNLVGANLTRGVALISSSFHICSQYLLWAIRSQGVRKIIFDGVNGSALQEIPLGNLRSVFIPVPRKDEQNTISDSLNSIESKINRLLEKFTKTTDTKKALMQDLLTGKVRVKQS